MCTAEDSARCSMGFPFYPHTYKRWPSLMMDDQYGFQALQSKEQYISYCLISKHRFLTNFDTNCFQSIYCMNHDLETSRRNYFYTVPDKSALKEKKKVKSWGLCNLIKYHVCYYINMNKHSFICWNFWLKYIPMRKGNVQGYYF